MGEVTGAAPRRHKTWLLLLVDFVPTLFRSVHRRLCNSSSPCWDCSAEVLAIFWSIPDKWKTRVLRERRIALNEGTLWNGAHRPGTTLRRARRAKRPRIAREWCGMRLSAFPPDMPSSARAQSRATFLYCSRRANGRPFLTLSNWLRKCLLHFLLPSRTLSRPAPHP